MESLSAGNDHNINNTLVEKCALDNSTQDSPSQMIFSTQPVLFIKWGKRTSGKITLQLVKLSGKTSFLSLLSTHLPFVIKAHQKCIYLHY